MVAAYLAGRQPYSLKIVPYHKREFQYDVYAGEVTFEEWHEKRGLPADTPLPRDLAADEIRIDLAGFVAERLYYCSDRIDVLDPDLRLGWYRQSFSDYALISTALFTITGDIDNLNDIAARKPRAELESPFNRAFQRIADETWDLLSIPKHWRAVTALASAALDHESLSGEEIVAILQPILGPVGCSRYG